MSAQSGSAMLLAIGNNDNTFSVVAGIRTRQFALNARSIDITSTDSDGWREILAGSGVKTCSVSGAGVFRDAASDALLRQTFFDNALRPWRLTIPSFGHLQGAFFITALRYNADHAAEVTFDISLESGGVVSFEGI